MLSFHVKFVQTDRRTDRRMDRRTMVKQYAPDLSMKKEIKGYIDRCTIYQDIPEIIVQNSIKHQ